MNGVATIPGACVASMSHTRLDGAGHPGGDAGEAHLEDTPARVEAEGAQHLLADGGVVDAEHLRVSPRRVSRRTSSSVR